MTLLEKTNATAPYENHAASLQAAAIQVASPIVLALMECHEELRNEAVGLLKQLATGELDEHERIATTTLLAEILFPNADNNGLPGVDLEEAELIAAKEFPESAKTISQMDHEEAVFAENLEALMVKKDMTQAQLAEKVGIGQPAISMMLNRSCRPQRKTIVRFAEALGVAPAELWPDFAG